jgi:hypothetical protein
LFRGLQKPGAELRAGLYCELFGLGEDDGACAGAFELCLAFITAVICFRIVFSMGGARLWRPITAVIYFSIVIYNGTAVDWTAPFR